MWFFRVTGEEMYSCKKTVRRKWCILTTLLRAIIDILCIYSANLHPNREDVGFISVNTEIFAKINKGKCFLQKKEEITLQFCLYLSGMLEAK